ncbi:putative serine/threonine protein kinase [Blattamonas nauphoetae]|uniref:non-specific serine/threonine protein kinase n=1 Tax=Blattamonas nauphoetae TaxID=2049346 RepID=A0ABQ9YGH9_9EUKA|nr:putative serine/threonine protein kinase [Blattamonas nauphoetae]
MKLDLEAFRHMGQEEFRCLAAIEAGMRNHEIVPVELILQLSGLRHGEGPNAIRSLLKYKLVQHDSKKYDGYRLTYLGYDYLALRALVKRGSVKVVQRQIGVGKESDIFAGIGPDGRMICLKFHRLGRTSFRAVRQKRDYLRSHQGKPGNWLYLSFLAASREFEYMSALYDNGFPTPIPIDRNRHCIVMSLVQGLPLAQVRSLPDPQLIKDEMLELLMRFGKCGLVHGDFNEFNVMVDEKMAGGNVLGSLETADGTALAFDDDFGDGDGDSDDGTAVRVIADPTSRTEKKEVKTERKVGLEKEWSIIVIDFPQLISVSHENAQEQFERDAMCVHAFFKRRFGIDWVYQKQDGEEESEGGDEDEDDSEQPAPSTPPLTHDEEPDEEQEDQSSQSGDEPAADMAADSEEFESADEHVALLDEAEQKDPPYPSFSFLQHEREILLATPDVVAQTGLTPNLDCVLGASGCEKRVWKKKERKEKEFTVAGSIRQREKKKERVSRNKNKFVRSRKGQELRTAHNDIKDAM